MLAAVGTLPRIVIQCVWYRERNDARKWLSRAAINSPERAGPQSSRRLAARKPNGNAASMRSSRRTGGPSTNTFACAGRCPADDVQDLTQEFFSRLIEKGFLDGYDPTRARLCSFLRVLISGAADPSAAPSRPAGTSSLHATHLV